MVDGRLQITSPRKARVFPPDVLLAAWQAATDLYEHTAAKDKKFKRAYEAYMAFRHQQYLWREVAVSLRQFHYPAARQGLTKLASGRE